MSFYCDINIYDDESSSKEYSVKYQKADIALINALEYIKQKDCQSAWKKISAKFIEIDKNIIETAEKLGQLWNFK